MHVFRKRLFTTVATKLQFCNRSMYLMLYLEVIFVKYMKSNQKYQYVILIAPNHVVLVGTNQSVPVKMVILHL